MSWAAAISRPATGDQGAHPKHKRSYRLFLVIALSVLALTFLLAVSLGRYSVPLNETARIIGDFILRATHLDGLLSIRRTWTTEEATVITMVRLPRAVLALLCGAALALAGAVLQAIFRNPLVSPDVIGVSSGASFGGVLAILLGVGGIGLVTSSFVFGLLAVSVVLLVGRMAPGNHVLTVVLGGIVIAALASALVSLVTYVADPYTTLPSITFWLIGSLSTASWAKVTLAAIPIVLGGIVCLTLRWRVNVLTLLDDEVRAVGVNPVPLRWLLIASVAMLAAATVATCGVIGWVGLVIPHIARLLLGEDHRQVLPASVLLGGTYLLLMDTVARSVSVTEIPVGILTAVVGAPIFLWLLLRRGAHRAGAL